ncbi:hypothetical protein B0H14DRAFT_3461008 [Mycena olivaceomarginata]|nr:hypothetical protein B0H14DRAFT_3461008 [Mycena olivaceomarginata]
MSLSYNHQRGERLLNDHLYNMPRALFVTVSYSPSCRRSIFHHSPTDEALERFWPSHLGYASFLETSQTWFRTGGIAEPEDNDMIAALADEDDDEMPPLIYEAMSAVSQCCGSRGCNKLKAKL